MITRGIYLDNRFYDYDPASYKIVLPIKTAISDSEFSRSFSVGGVSKKQFTLRLNLWNEYEVRSGVNVIGTTIWYGVSRLSDLKTIINATGTSLPINFLSPAGVSYPVIPVGDIEILIDNPTNLGASGVEFRVNLTLQDITND